MNQAIAEPASRASRLPLQAWAESGLAKHPFRLELRGSTESLTWPNICANCGSRADERVAVRKIFTRRPVGGRRRRSPARSTTGLARVPFCAECVQQHRAMEKHDSGTARILGGLLHPLMIPVVGSAYFGQLTLRQALPISPFAPGAWVIWGLTAILGLTFVWSLFLLWRDGMRRGIPPQTEITCACDFSADVSQFFERERRIYAMRNQAFADAMAASNADRVWTQQDQARSRRNSQIVAVAFFAIILVVWLGIQLFRG